MGKYGIEDLLTPKEIPTAFGYTIEWEPQSVTIADKDVEIEGTWKLSEIVINEEISYDLKHKDKLLRIASGGMLTINLPDATVKRLTIEEGGTLLLTQPLTVTDDFTMQRTLQNQWETFCPPTDLTADKMAINADGGLWLSTGFLTTDKQEWEPVNGLTSDIPYIIASDVAYTKVTFSGTDYPIELPAASVDLKTPEADGILFFQGNPSFATKTVSNVYALNDAGTAFELQEGTYTMRPFECVLTANAATRGVLRSLRLDDGNPTGVIELLRGDFRAWGADGLLHLRSAAPADVHIYNVGGSPVAHLPALAGDRTLRLPAGIYLVKYKQTTIKIKL
ncbi:hypothetical protein [Parabacteroides sp.]